MIAISNPARCQCLFSSVVAVGIRDDSVLVLGGQDGPLAAVQYRDMVNKMLGSLKEIMDSEKPPVHQILSNINLEKSCIII